jgi:hypothetical protein
MQQRNTAGILPMKTLSFYPLQMMQHERTALHVSKAHFTLVKPSFVALLGLFEEERDAAPITL